MPPVLIVGASGKLGGAVARLLLAAGEPVRAMSRTPDRLKALRELGAEVVAGSLTDAISLERACAGADRVLAAAHAFVGTGPNAMEHVDDAGNRRLIDAARDAGTVRHFIFTSACFTPNDPVDFFRTKYAVEQYLRASGLPFTILRPTAFMEDHAERIGRPAVEHGVTMVLGEGKNPTNYVAMEDVAQVAATLLRGEPVNDVVHVAGPEQLSALDVVATYERVSGRRVRVLRVPRSVVRGARRLLAPVSPVVARILDLALFSDTSPNMRVDGSATRERFGVRPTSLEEFVRRRWEAGAYKGGGRRAAGEEARPAPSATG